MVSPSKTKYSRVAANQQQKTASSNKVKLVKGPRPLIYHRFYLDIQRHQLANEIESTIKELGGKIEFFLNKEITHFITDKDYQQQQQQHPRQPHQQRATESDGGPSSQQLQHQPATPTTPQTPRTPLSYAYHPHLQQYLNEASPSSPCIGGTPNPTPSASGSTAIKPSIPRSRADAMLQRVRQQQQQQQQQNSSNNPASAPPSSPCSPASHNSTFRTQFDRTNQQQSPAHLAKSWGKPIWTTEYAIKFFKKVIETCRGGDQPGPQQSLGKHGVGGGVAGGPTTSSTTSEARKSANIQHLRGDFLKIESYQRHYRPAFQLFKKWPLLNLNTRSSASPFNSDRERKSIKTTTTTAATNQPKTATAHTNNNTANTNARAKPTQQQQQQRCGYCEICRIEYDVLANHLAAEEHSAFVKNDANFVSLDKLISDGGVDLKTFLSANQTRVEEEEEEEQEKAKEEEESAKRNAESEGGEKDTEVRVCEREEKAENISEKDREKSVKEEKEEENIRIQEREEEARGSSKQESAPPREVRTYSRKLKDKNRICATDDPESHGSSTRSPPAKRTYAGRKQARRAAALAAQSPSAPVAAPAPEPPAQTDEDLPPESSKPPIIKEAAEEQMFGRRSAIHHHPHNTLNHHNHQKVKAARQLQQQTILNSSGVVTVPIPSTVVVPEPPADEMKVLDNDPISNGPSEKEKEKDRQSKRGAADRMGLKGSSLKPTVVHHPVEMLECEGLDPKNTKRISLGLRQNPKRANLNEDFTSLLDETLGPMRKPRVRRESAKRVNYSEPREDEIQSQEEIMQSILEKTAKEASENEAKKKKPGSPKRPLDVKIRGIRWRAPSPQARPPVKSPLLYKVIEDPKPHKSKKTASPTKGSKEAGSPSKSNKNGLIVKIRRVRQSELSLLNDEAENFMFPKKDDSSDAETDEDRNTTSELGPGDLSQDLPSSELDHRNSLSMRKQACTPSGRKRTTSMKLLPPESPSKKAAKDSDQESTPRSRRAARGPAALLQDNAEYYKFPDPGSRLRFPEAPIQPSPAAAAAAVEDDDDGKHQQPSKGRGGKRCRAKTPAPATMTSSSQKQHEHDILLAMRSSTSSPYHHQEQLSNCGKNIINYVKGKEDGMGVFRWSNFRKNCKEIEPYRFAFERVPSLEPWYETFQRQDDCSELMYEYFGNTAYRKLPFEMGPLPPLKQNCCILNYRIKSKTPEAAGPTSSASSCSSSTTSSSSGGHNATTTSTAAHPTDDKQPLALPLKKRKLLVDSDRPRKSPREHASTLAILSLLHHQQQQHNRRRTFSGNSSIPIVTANLPPPSPTPSAYSPKKAAIQAHQNNQEADSALGDEIRSSCGSDPVTEKEDHGAKKIKFDPPVLEENFVNYKAMCQELDDFLSGVGSEGDEDDGPLLLGGLRKKTVPIGIKQPLRQNFSDIVRACDRDPPLSLKQVSRHESIVRKIVQYDRKPRPLSAVSIKSFDGGGGGGNLGLFRKRINRTGWPNVKKRIVTRKQQQQQLKVKKEGEEGAESMKKEDGESGVVVDGEGSRKSSTEESQISGLTADTTMVKEEDEEDDDEDEFEDTMTMLDDEEPNGKMGSLLTEDEEEIDEELVNLETPKKIERGRTPCPSKMEEGRLSSSRVLPSSKYVTKTTTTMTRVDYNVPPLSSSSITTTTTTTIVSEVLPVPNHAITTITGKGSKSTSTSCPVAVTTTAEDDDKECDSISSRSIFVSDDCDTTSSTLINMQCTEDPLAIPPGSQRNSSATPQPEASDELAPQPSRQSRPMSRARQNTTRHLSYGAAAATGPLSKRKPDTLQPVVCIEKLNCPTTMRTRSSSRTPVKTYKRSIFTSALVNSAGKPLKRKKKKKHKLNGSIGSSPSPSCSEELNSASSSLECEDPATLECDTGRPQSADRRKSIKDRPPTPSPAKYSPRKLRKPRGRWYRER